MQDIFATTTSFADLGLSDALLKGIKDQGFEHPTIIQSQLIPLAISGKDVLGQSKTGTGKTAAFGLPALHLLDGSVPFACLCLVPTRELAIQVTREMRELGSHSKLKVLAVYGGQSINTQAEQLKKKPHIIVGTPGRVMDMHQRGLLPYDKIQLAMLDEVDRMLDIGFREDIRKILGGIKQNHQTIFVSATISDEIMRLAKKYMNDPVDLSLREAKSLTVAQVNQECVSVPDWDKQRMLHHVIKIEKPDLVLVFCRMKVTVDRVAKSLQRKNIDALVLHANLHQGKRDKVMDRLRKREVRVVVASDLAARGIDVDNITHVINYDVPEDPEVYVHRIGRTARKGQSGKAIMFVTPEQSELLMGIERLTNVEIPTRVFDDFKPGPEPDRIQQDRARLEKEREAMRKANSRTIDELPAETLGDDPSKFPGGLVPKELPKKRMGGRLRTRRR
ncbi:MAG: DEAD/DEAH box helicase [Phycisphaerales bacterium]|nr:DEAD/DEAH box helicase [Phycisphaerales bacterium]